MKNSVSVYWVANILDPLPTRKHISVPAGTTIGRALLEFVPLAPPDFEVVASINGELLDIPRTDIALLEGDCLVMTARPRGGGGGGSNPLSIIAMVAVMVVASVVTFGVSSLAATGAWSWGMGMASGVGFGAALAGGLAGAAVVGLGGYLVSQAFKTKLPDFGTKDAIGSSPTYSWATQGNPLAEGPTLPVLYGTWLVVPPLVARYVESKGKSQYLNMLYAIAGHKVDAIDAVFINDQPSTFYRKTQLNIRNGELNQEVIPYFHDLVEEVNYNVKLQSSEWVTRSLPGSAQGVVIGISYRLYYANDKGGMDPLTAKVNIEYRRKGDADWTRYIRYVKELRSFERQVSYWSYGKWVRHHDKYGSGKNEWRETGSSPNPQDKPPYMVPSWKDPNKLVINTAEYDKWRWLTKTEKYEEWVTVPYNYIEITGSDAAMQRYTLRLDNIPEGEYEARLKLASALPSGPRYGTEVQWEFVQLIQYDDFTYPSTALVGVRSLGTDQLSGGQPVIKVQATRASVFVYNPYFNRYELKAATNPAWASYDALHNGSLGHPDPAVYGLCVPFTRIVYADFADWAAYCDKKGYTTNIYIESPVSGSAILDMLGQMGRGRVQQIGSRFTCHYEHPVDLPKQQFLAGLGNIVAKTFTKEWLPLQDRANVVEITYFDKEAEYQRKVVEVYQRGFDQASRNINKTSITLYACNNMRDALRFGRGLMLRNWYLTYTPSFEVNTDALHCLPGDVISLAEDYLQGGTSGRIVDISGHAITLDAVVTLLPNVQYALEWQDIATDKRGSTYIIGVSQETKTDTIYPLSVDSLPSVQSKYAFGYVGRTSRLFSITAMQTAADLRKRVHLLEYIPEIYDDDVVDLPDDSVTNYAFVRNLQASEVWQQEPDGSGRSVIALWWQGQAVYWNVWLRIIDGNWQKVAQVTSPRYTIESGLQSGQSYDIVVSIGSADIGEVAHITLRGKTAPPNNVDGFTSVAQGDFVKFSWNHIPDADLWGYQIREGANWETSKIILDGVSKNTATWQPPLDGTYKFWIKAIDDSNIYSVVAASAMLTIDISSSLNIVWEQDELPTPAGEYQYFVHKDNALYWLPALTDTDLPDYTDMDVVYRGDNQSGVYETPVYDVGVVTPLTLRLDIGFFAYASVATDISYPNRTDQTYPEDTDVLVSSLSSWRAEYRYGIDDAMSAWLEWTTPHDIEARYIQVRYIAMLDSDVTRYAFTRLKMIADVPDQSAIFAANVPDSGLVVTMEDAGLRPMVKGYHVGVTVYGTSALYGVVEKQDQSFTVRCFDAAGNAYSASCGIEIRGF